MIPWQTIQSLLLFFGPLLLPKAISLYRSITTSRPNTPPHAPSPPTQRTLTLLTISALLALLSTLPLMHPTNPFRATNSRLSTPASVLLTRLKALRPLTPADEALRSFLDKGGMEARLLYARFGPGVVDASASGIGDLGAGDAWGWLLYALPGLAGWHCAHLFVLGLATSQVFGGGEAAGWRFWAVLAGVALAGLEIWAVAGYDDTGNARARRAGEVEFLFWKGLVWRGVGVALVDGVLGWVVWLQGTGRGWVRKREVGERVGELGVVLEGLVGRARGLGVVRNAVGRDRELRERVEDYWVKDEEVMRDVGEEGEVVAAQRKALERVDLRRLEGEAEKSVEAILGSVKVLRR